MSSNEKCEWFLPNRIQWKPKSNFYYREFSFKQQLYTVKFTRHVCVLWSVYVFSFSVCLMLSIDLDISFDIHWFILGKKVVYCIRIRKKGKKFYQTRENVVWKKVIFERDFKQDPHSWTLTQTPFDLSVLCFIIWKLVFQRITKWKRLEYHRKMLTNY